MSFALRRVVEHDVARTFRTRDKASEDLASPQRRPENEIQLSLMRQGNDSLSLPGLERPG
jgi:hypothetical protein